MAVLPANARRSAMATPLALTAQAIDVLPFGARLAGARTCALFKSQDMEVIRVVLRASQSLPPHKVPGSVSLHCLEGEDRKSTRLNSSHLVISYAVFCLKKK